METSALANPSTARSSASPHATSRDRHLRSGRPGWKPQARQTRRVGTVFLSVRSLTAMCALGVTGSANWVVQAERSPATSQVKIRRHAPSRSGSTAPQDLSCAGFYGPRQGRPRLTTSGSSAWPAGQRKLQLSRPRGAGPLKRSKSGSSALHRAGLQQHSIRCVGFRVHGPHLAGPARKLKLTIQVRFIGPAPGRPAATLSPLHRVLRSSTGRPRSGAQVTS